LSSEACAFAFEKASSHRLAKEDKDLHNTSTSILEIVKKVRKSQQYIAKRGPSSKKALQKGLFEKNQQTMSYQNDNV